MTTVAGVLGSVTPPGRLRKALEHALAFCAAGDPSAQTRLVDLAEYRLSFAGGQPLEHLADDTPAVVEMVSEADAVIVASPVYRASFTGSLKNLLDLLPVEALQGKPCGIIAMGATDHHYLGVDWHLRDVLSWFGAFTAPTSVYLSSADFTEGELSERARDDLEALCRTLLRLQAFAATMREPFGPLPLAARQR